MAGHSKWAQIKRQKGVNDARRGALFTRLGNQLAIAARAGTDPQTNPTLAMVIEKAKAANMPLSNIERAINRVKDRQAAELHEVLYEGYGPGGVAILVECATDNLNRTYPEVRAAFSKHGGSIAEKGAVSYLFQRKGVIRIEGSGEENLLMALECGADDVVEEDDGMVAVTAMPRLAEVRRRLLDAGITIRDAELSYEPTMSVQVEDEQTYAKIVRLLEALEDCDDVVNTYTNLA